jgi:hypothetical protein
MTTDSALKFLGVPVPLAINQFYARRVLQRCERGELTVLDAAELLTAAASLGGDRIAGPTVRTPNSS